jgi:hypothetical protein
VRYTSRSSVEPPLQLGLTRRSFFVSFESAKALIRNSFIGSISGLPVKLESRSGDIFAYILGLVRLRNKRGKNSGGPTEGDGQT